MRFDCTEDAIKHVASSEEIFALERRDIRGVTFTTFKNGPRTLRDYLVLCLRHGDRDFLVYEDERYSFSEVHAAIQKLSKALVTDFGVKPGERVGLLMRNCPEYPMLFMAIACAGAVPVFLNSWWTSQELEYAFAKCEAKLAFVDEPRSANLDPFAEALGVRQVLARTATMDKVQSFWDIIDTRDETVLPDVKIDPDDDFCVMYTSGSSGHPKGVVLTHRSAVSAIQSWLFSIQVSNLMGWAPNPPIDDDGNAYQPCTMITTPFFHISATHAGFLLALWIGMKAVIMSKWAPARAVELIDREQVSRFACVPTMSAELLEAAAKMGSKLRSLRTIDSGGAKRPANQVAEIAARVPHAMPGTGFGMTETGGPGIGMRGEPYLQNPEAAGRLQPPLMEMRIVDDEDKEVSVGEVGELVLKSVTNLRCYLDEPQATSEALRDGWLYTGDLARADEEGVITIVDRKKDMIIRGGENISCSEVSAALHLHPNVIEGLVFSIPDDRLGEKVGACVYLSANCTTTEEELKDFLVPHLASFKIPKKIWLRDAPLPRGATEKIDRLAVRAEYLG